MRKRIWLSSLVLAVILATTALVGLVARQLLPDAGEREKVSLFLSAEPPVGGYGDPKSGARWEEERRVIGRELSRLLERGAIRCRLRVAPAKAEDPELAVDLTNESNERVTLRGHQDVRDFVTFILRDPEGEVVGTFCYANSHSMVRNPPPVTTIEAGETETMTVYLSVAAGRGFQRLQPGLHSIEAVFCDPIIFSSPVGGPRMIARSARLPVRVAPQKS